ncbi:MAG: DUF3891 family protein [Thermoanaerobaculia bacterium]
MIARSTPAGLCLISQPDHAALARRIMERCVALDDHPRREAILVAIGEHDGGWAEIDAAPVVDPASGRLADFIHLPLALRHAVWPRGVARLAHSPWAAALVAHHALTVYDRFRPDSTWDDFFAGMATARAAMIRASGLTLDDLVADYPFLRLGDLISLAFCTAASDELKFAEWTVRLDDARVVVSPDPFGGRKIPFEIAGLEIPDRAYRTNAELRAELAVAARLPFFGEVNGTP